MFEWFNKYIKETEELKETKEANNYKTDDDGNIKIYAQLNEFWCASNLSISEESIISHTKEEIIFKDYECHYNHEVSGLPIRRLAIEKKENLIEYKETVIKTLKYDSFFKECGIAKRDVIGKEVTSEKTPLEVFKEDFDSKHKLIETEEEFNEYMSSTLDCDTWSRKKLYNKMKELGLGDGFINQFADLIGNDLDKYHAMIDLANEVSDKDTLMYLYTYKFKQ